MFWIHTQNTITPSGLNNDFRLKCFLKDWQWFTPCYWRVAYFLFKLCSVWARYPTVVYKHRLQTLLLCLCSLWFILWDIYYNPLRSKWNHRDLMWAYRNPMINIFIFQCFLPWWSTTRLKCWHIVGRYDWYAATDPNAMKAANLQLVLRNREYAQIYQNCGIHNQTISKFLFSHPQMHIYKWKNYAHYA